MECWGKTLPQRWHLSKGLENAKEEATKISRGKTLQAKGTAKAKTLVDVKRLTHCVNTNS